MVTVCLSNVSVPHNMILLYFHLLIFVSQIVFYFSHSILLLFFDIDVVLTLSTDVSTFSKKLQLLSVRQCMLNMNTRKFL